ncbi:nuclear transport factor 2 family protein [Ruoffia sp. FAM 24228]|uniref:Nuclear transport factor 2 family protein n=1 Tax=Ruoffia tabacinasalis TaxID=87458 RepID=A0A5R9DSX9_9LACT|nr:nuclear transport factor 2 family protein [Ruoffia tabacinasalis]TLQ39947.1 nuclear transport factor 2 family protein [Ruoffia tabacinasalis]
MLEKIARDFSVGEFESAYTFLSEDIKWHVVGESTTQGREDVMERCQQSRDYFDSIETDFTVFKLIESGNQVIITGSGIFDNNGVVSRIDACDIYTFNEEHQLIEIESYCVPV